MKTKANYFKIGMFVILAILILIIGLIALSARALIQDVVYIETYIDESVLGLSVGSSVIQRGVQIGTVEQITFVSHEYFDQLNDHDFQTFNRYVMVISKVNAKSFRGLGLNDNLKTIIQQSIDNGLRLRLSPQGITGIYYLEADYVDPERYPPLQLKWNPKYYYIPSSPSTLTSFTQSLDIVLQDLTKVNFEQVARSLEQTLQSMRQLLEDAKIGETRAELSELMATLKQAITDARITELRQQLNELLNSLGQSSQMFQDAIGPAPPGQAKTFRETIAQLHSSLRQMERLVAMEESDIDEMVDNLKRASENLREATEKVKRYPSLLLFSEPPQKSEVTQ
ncbi:MAG: MCE family protein [Sedimentisphaerales bacterium]|nr:MCE family protein [Sedimentisphaerales bacterium]